MTDSDLKERLIEAEILRADAAADERRAAELSEENPTYAGYLQRRADWQRYLAANRDGGR